MRLNKVLLLVSAFLIIGGCAKRRAQQPGQYGGAPQYEEFGGGSAVAGSSEDFRINVGDRVFFGLNRTDLTQEAQQTLERQAAWLRQYGEVRLTIEGHADERGTREYNLAIGQRRAESAKRYLVSLGVDSGRLDTVSFGKDQPEDPSSNESAWAKNRRAVSVITGGLY